MENFTITLTNFKKVILTSLLSIILRETKAQLSFTLSSNVCQNDTLSMSANIGTLSIQGYSWSSIPFGVNFSTPLNNTTNATFTNVANYTIVLTVISGSNTYSAQNLIVVNTNPTITLAQSSLSTCITLNPSFSKPVILSANGAISYTWSPLPFTIGGNPNGPSYTARPQTSSCYTVKGSNSNGCKASAITCITVIPRFSVNVSPTSATVCSSNVLYESFTFAISTPTSGAFGTPSSFTFTWLANRPLGIGIKTLSATTIGFVPFANTTLSVEVSDSLGCVSLPATATVYAQDCTSLSEFSGVEQKFYPNPTTGIITLINFKPSDSIEFTNSLGQSLFKLDIPDNKREVNISHLPNGIYFLKAESRQGQSVFKVVKE